MSDAMVLAISIWGGLAIFVALLVIEEWGAEIADLAKRAIDRITE